MVSPTINVVRYSALLGGVFYGIYHRSTLQKAYDAHKLEHAAHERKHLISEAKEAFKKKLAAEKADAGIVSDPEDPRFDLEKYIAKVEAES